MDVQKATSEDLAAVLCGLEREYAEDDDEGFWCNRSIIERALEHGDLWVIRRESEPSALQFGSDAGCPSMPTKLTGVKLATKLRKRREQRRSGVASFATLDGRVKEAGAPGHISCYASLASLE